jgi:Tetratricopeptide repeat
MRCAVAIPVFFVVAMPILGAQGTSVVPKRPQLPAGADTNDAAAYYQLGHEAVATKPRLAADAFYWATRLNPYAAQAYYGRYAALLLDNPRRLARYLHGDRKVVESAEMKQIDSLLLRALMLDPFLYRNYDHLVLREYYRWQLPVVVPQAVADRHFANWVLRASKAIQAWVAYCEGRFFDALRDYRDAATAAPRKADLRTQRARVFYLTDQLDSALAEFALALSEFEDRDNTEIVGAYASKALLAHSMARIHEQLGDRHAARDAYARALQEDLAFYPAHRNLGLLALQQGDTATGLSELELAIQLRDDEPMLRLFYGYLLSQLERHADAELQLTKAIALEPLYARSYQLLGQVYEAQGQREQALVQYEAYLARAARTDPPREVIARRLPALRGQGGR